MTSSYRTTLRMHPVFKDYLDQLFHCTRLDRTQLIRMAIATAPENPAFLKLLKQYQKPKTTLPFALWDVEDYDIFLEQCPELELESVRGGEGYHDDVSTKTTEMKTSARDSKQTEAGSENIQNRSFQPTERRAGEVLERRIFKESGGIKITIN